MKTRIFILSKDASSYGVTPTDLRNIAEYLEQEGAIHIVYSLRVRAQEEEQKVDIAKSVNALVDFLRPFHSNFSVESYFSVGEHRVHVHVMLEASVVHFTEAPWHSDNSAHGQNVPRLIKAVQSNKPLVVSYSYIDEPRGRAVDRGEVQVAMCRLLRTHGFTGLRIGVIRQDWPLEPGGKCRIDVRIEPKKETPDVS